MTLIVIISEALNEPEEKDKLLRSLGPVSKVLLLSNHGALCCGETIEEAFYHVTHMVHACEAQLKLLPVGLENLILIPEETRKAIYDAARKPSGEGQEAASAQTADNKEGQLTKVSRLGFQYLYYKSARYLCDRRFCMINNFIQFHNVFRPRSGVLGVPSLKPLCECSITPASVPVTSSAIR